MERDRQRLAATGSPNINLGSQTLPAEDDAARLTKCSTASLWRGLGAISAFPGLWRRDRGTPVMRPHNGSGAPVGVPAMGLESPFAEKNGSESLGSVERCAPNSLASPVLPCAVRADLTLGAAGYKSASHNVPSRAAERLSGQTTCWGSTAPLSSAQPTASQVALTTFYGQESSLCHT